MSASAERLRDRIESLRGTPAFGHYVRARDHVLQYLDGEGTEPSAYWREELENIDYLLDASPLIVGKLRHHCFHVTGVRPYEYRSGQPERARLFASRIRALQALGRPDLVVEESPALGGFGFDVDGGLYNLDSAKFSEVLIALDLAGVLGPLREPSSRKLVVEIGAGWGGFAYHFKRLCPDVTYVIVDLPELLLFSGTYLPTVLPTARIGYWGEGGPLVDWQEYDVVLVPHTALDAMRPERVDLTLNMVSFQEMTTAQVEGYAQHAWDVGSAAIYSLNRDRSLYNHELTGVRSILSRWYDLTEIQVLPLPYNELTGRQGAIRRVTRAVRARVNADDVEYHHVVGLRRESSLA